MKSSQKPIRELWAHQKIAVERARELHNYGLFFEPGAGKTAACIHMLREKYTKHKRLLRTLVFCPPIVIDNWKNEFLINSRISPDNIVCLFGSGKKRKDLFLKYADSPRVFITNYETLSMDIFDEFLKWDAEAVVFDESHRLANIKSARSKLSDKLVNHKMIYNKKTGHLSGDRPYVYILSGSPILNSPMDIFNQYKVLDGGHTFSANFFGFRGRYFKDHNAGMPPQRYFPDWRPIPGAMEEIGKKLDANSMRVRKEDCLDLPPLVRKTIAVEMTSEQSKLYQSMLKEFVAYLIQGGEEHVTSAVMALTKSLRLMQISSGYIKTVGGEEVDISGDELNPKQKALKELLETITIENKCIVWAVWIQNYEQIRRVLESLDLKWLEITGEQGAEKNRKNAKEFEENKDIKVLIAHPESGGEGINLVSASYAITYSRTFSLRQDIQAEARNYRGGSEIHEKVTRIDLVTKDTIEEKILERLAKKEEVSEKILREITFNLVGEK